MNCFPESLEKLIAELSKLPGVGPKTAQRLAFHILEQKNNGAERLASALVTAAEKLDECLFSYCGGGALRAL